MAIPADRPTQPARPHRRRRGRLPQRAARLRGRCDRAASVRGHRAQPDRLELRARRRGGAADRRHRERPAVPRRLPLPRDAARGLRAQPRLATGASARAADGGHSDVHPRRPDLLRAGGARQGATDRRHRDRTRRRAAHGRAAARRRGGEHAVGAVRARVARRARAPGDDRGRGVRVQQGAARAAAPGAARPRASRRRAGRLPPIARTRRISGGRSLCSCRSTAVAALRFRGGGQDLEQRSTVPLASRSTKGRAASTCGASACAAEERPPVPPDGWSAAVLPWICT